MSKKNQTSAATETTTVSAAQIAANVAENAAMAAKAKVDAEKLAAKKAADEAKADAKEQVRLAREEAKAARLEKIEAAKAARDALIATAPAAEKVAADINVTRARISLGTEISWTVPEVRAKRAQRSAVIVDGEEYKSVRDAFTALALPDCKHIAFRGKLKAAMSLTAFGHEWEIVPLNY